MPARTCPALAAARAVTYLPFQAGLVIVVVIVGQLADSVTAFGARHRVVPSACLTSPAQGLHVPPPGQKSPDRELEHGQGKLEVYGARVYARNASVVDRG